MSQIYLDRAKKSVDDIAEAGVQTPLKLEELRKLRDYINQKYKELKRGD